MRSIEWWHFHWPWRTSTRFSKSRQFLRSNILKNEWTKLLFKLIWNHTEHIERYHVLLVKPFLSSPHCVTCSYFIVFVSVGQIKLSCIYLSHFLSAAIFAINPAAVADLSIKIRRWRDHCHNTTHGLSSRTTKARECPYVILLPFRL